MQILIGFSSAKKWHILTAIVKLVEGTPFSHVYVRVIDGEKDFVCNIAPDEERSIPYNDFLQANRIEREFPLPYAADRLESIVKKLEPSSHLYNFYKIFAIAWGRLIRNPKAKSVSFLWNRRGGIICTEYAAEILTAAGYHIDVDLMAVGPKGIFNKLGSLFSK